MIENNLGVKEKRWNKPIDASPHLVLKKPIIFSIPSPHPEETDSTASVPGHHNIRSERGKIVFP